MSFGLIGEVFALAITLKAVENINGEPHKLEKAHSDKASADEHAKRLKKQGKKVRVLKRKDKNGKTVYGVYSKVEKTKKKPKKE
jgi:hypothetical protein